MARTIIVQGKDRNARCRCHLRHQQEPQLRNGQQYKDRLQEKGQEDKTPRTLQTTCRNDNQGKGHTPRGELRYGQRTFSPEKDKGTQQKDRDTLDIFWDTHFKCPQHWTANPKSVPKGSLELPQNSIKQKPTGVTMFITEWEELINSFEDFEY